MAERMAELTERQDQITESKRDGLVGQTRRVLIDSPGIARSSAEAPDIDGVIIVPEDLATGTMVLVEITESLGTDVVGVPVVAR